MSESRRITYRKLLADIPHQQRTESAESLGANKKRKRERHIPGSPGSQTLEPGSKKIRSDEAVKDMSRCVCTFDRLGKVMHHYVTVTFWKAHRRPPQVGKAAAYLESIVKDLVKLLVKHQSKIAFTENRPNPEDCDKLEDVGERVRAYCLQGFVDVAILMSIAKADHDEQLMTDLLELCRKVLEIY
jgi:hypothetical protein